MPVILSTVKRGFLHHLPNLPSLTGVWEHTSSTRMCLLTVSSDDLYLWVFLFDVLDHVDLEDGVALRGILERKKEKKKKTEIRERNRVSPNQNIEKDFFFFFLL